MRIFIALNFDKPAKDEMIAVQRQLQQAAGKGNFTSEENLHLTLVFLGEIDRARIEDAKRAIGKTVASDRQIDEAAIRSATARSSNSKLSQQLNIDQPALTLQFDRIGHFTKERSGDIWWIGLKNNNKLNRMQRRLSRELITAGFELEKRKFTPHLTLARQVRLKPDLITDEFKLDMRPFSTDINKISLMSSDRINDVLAYTEIWSAPIK
jgi:2'-5' RNA ligase